MANWSTEPGLGQLWQNFVNSIKARDEALAKMDFSGESNIPTGTIRWDNTNGYFQRWSGSTWQTLSNVAQTSQVVPNTRQVIAGSGLTGGGALSSNVTLNVGAGTGITVGSNTVSLDTSNTRNVDHSSVSITAGNGLTGGGTIDASRTLNVGAGTGITVGSNSVSLDTSHTRNTDHASVSITGSGALGGGGTITANRTITMNTPGTLTRNSTNSASTNHTHAIGGGIVKAHVNSGGQITVSTSNPSGGTNGDIWFRV